MKKKKQPPNQTQFWNLAVEPVEPDRGRMGSRWRDPTAEELEAAPSMEGYAEAARSHVCRVFHRAKLDKARFGASVSSGGGRVYVSFWVGDGDTRFYEDIGVAQIYNRGMGEFDRLLETALSNVALRAAEQGCAECAIEMAALTADLHKRRER